MVNALRADRHEVLMPARNATSDLSERLTGNRCRARVSIFERSVENAFECHKSALGPRSSGMFAVVGSRRRSEVMIEGRKALAVLAPVKEMLDGVVLRLGARVERAANGAPRLLPVEAVIRRKDLEGFAKHDCLPNMACSKVSAL
jgi:hypothetical protein